MKRFSLLALILILVAAFSASAVPNSSTAKAPPFPGTLANARYVYVLRNVGYLDRLACSTFNAVGDLVCGTHSASTPRARNFDKIFCHDLGVGAALGIVRLNLGEANKRHKLIRAWSNGEAFRGFETGLLHCANPNEQHSARACQR